MPDLDQVRLGDWLRCNVEGFRGPFSIAKFPGGQSNPTYAIAAASGGYVLRRQPFGAILPSAHAVEREYAILGALHPTGFPVPKTFALCLEHEVIGSRFYVMERVHGCNYWDGALPEISRRDRSAVYASIIDTLGDLHSIDAKLVNPEADTKGRGYFGRQVRRWTAQYRATQTEEVEAVERLIEWLPSRLPEQGQVSIVHGDYRIDNLIFDCGNSVRAVIDWELSTVGDPVADLTYLLMNWVMEADGRAALGGLDLSMLGLPSLDDAIARYASRTGFAVPMKLDWYFAFNMFRGAAIIQGIRHREMHGNASSGDTGPVIAKLRPFAEAGWTLARRAGA